MKQIKGQNDFSTQISEIEISYIPKIKPSQLPTVRSSQDTYNHVLPLWKHIDYFESFAILLLNRSNRILGLRWISTGAISGTVCDPKKIFQAALKANSSGMILLHNHPSGQLFPSDADKSLTNKLKQGSSYLDISLLDHVILTSESYYSFADEGII